MEIKLPKPRRKGVLSVEEAIYRRRSVRRYRKASLTLDEVGQLLWAAQGITSPGGFRSAPSGGATYPLETYLVAGEVEGLAAGLYHYKPEPHSLTIVKEEDLRRDLARAALGQGMVEEAPITIVVSAIYQRTTGRYGKRGIRYVLMEIGHVGENVHLQAESLDLRTVMIGAFEDQEVKRVLGLKEEEPLYLMPVGRK